MSDSTPGASGAGRSAPHSWTVDGPQVLDLEGVTRLDATIIKGRIDVVAHEDPAATSARVEVHEVDGRELEIRFDADGTLRIGYTFLESGWKGIVEKFRTYNGKDSVDVHVALPPGTDVKVATVRGEGLVAGVRAGARASTVAGSVLTAHTRGHLRVETVSGEVTVSDHEGRLTMDSVSGDLTATGRLEEIKLDTVSGGVTLDSGTTPELISVNGVSADVVVRLPDPDAMSYALRSVSGRLLVDGVEYRTSAGSFKHPADPTQALGLAPLTVNAVSGNVTILRGDRAAPGPWGSPAEDAFAGAVPHDVQDAVPSDVPPADEPFPSDGPVGR